jgi:hypothetical protein
MRQSNWLDGDILFSTDCWVEETSELLEEDKVVQPYQIAAWLPDGGDNQWPPDLPNMPGLAFAMCHAAEYEN